MAYLFRVSALARIMAIQNAPGSITVDDKAGSLALPNADEMPKEYNRLLAEYVERLKGMELNPYQSFAKLLLLSFNPRFQWRLWTSRYLQDFIRVPDAVRQDLPYAAEILKSIQVLNDGQLRAFAQCSRLNVGKLTNRFLFGGLNKAFVTVVTLVGAAKGFKEMFGIDLASYVPLLMPIIGPSLLGLAAGVIFNLLVWYQRLRLVRAFDDIISIAVAARGLKQ